MNQRIFGLDLVRAMAIIFVLLAHSRDYLPSELDGWIKLIIIDGVDIFFVLSGFLIGGIILKEFSENISLKALKVFWIRRWFRTLPNYFFILILVILISKLIGLNIRFKDWTPYFFFLQNFASPHPPFFPEAWSLSVEEWFYLILPILIFSIFKLTNSFNKSILLSSLLIIVVSVSFRIILFSKYSGDLEEIFDPLFRKTVLSRLDSLMIGILTAYISFYHPVGFKRYCFYAFLSGIGFFIILKLIPINSNYILVFSPTISAVMIALTIPFFYYLKIPVKWISIPLTFTSKISYSLYLVNYTLIKYYLIEEIGLSSSFLKFILFWVITFGVSFMTYNWIERPFLAIRDKYTGKIRQLES